MKKWKILNKTNVSPSKWFPVERHTVEIENGKIIDDYFIAPFGEIAMVLPFTKQGEIIFVKQYKHGINEILLELPAGFRQLNTTIEATAVAELEEETGIKITTTALEFLGKLTNMPTKLKSITYGFLAKDLVFNSTQNLDETEHIELVMIKPQKALAMIENNEIWAVDTVAFLLKAQLKYPMLFKN